MTPFAYSDSQALAGWVNSLPTGIYYPNGVEQKRHFSNHLYEILPEDPLEPPKYFVESFDGERYFREETPKHWAESLILKHGI